MRLAGYSRITASTASANTTIRIWPYARRASDATSMTIAPATGHAALFAGRP